MTAYRVATEDAPRGLLGRASTLRGAKGVERPELRTVVAGTKSDFFQSRSSHLNGLALSIRQCANVTEKIIIGFLDNTGGPDIPVCYSHLHQTYYRYPSHNSDGSPDGAWAWG